MSELADLGPPPAAGLPPVTYSPGYDPADITDRARVAAAWTLPTRPFRGAHTARGDGGQHGAAAELALDIGAPGPHCP